MFYYKLKVDICINQNRKEMKTKKESEIIYLGIEESKLMDQAVKNVTKRTMVLNSSITFNEQGQMIIEDTFASFLLNVGIEYSKLINHKCPVCFSEIDWNK